MQVNAIIAEDIVRHYSTGRGIEGVSLSVPAGQCIGILGANGSGKTTLTRVVAGLDGTGGGHLSVLGGPACPRPRELRRRCGVALEGPAHWDGLSGRQNLWFFARQYGLAGSALGTRVHELLREAGLDKQADDPVAAYSFGMRRKLSIIEAISGDPDLLILDEPSAGADAAFLDRLIQWIRDRCDHGQTTWLADNDPDWVARAATHAVLLCDGRIRAQGEVRRLTNSASPTQHVEITLEQPCSEVPLDLPAARGVHAFSCEQNHLTAQVRGGPNAPVELLAWITSRGACVRSMQVHAATLYDALMQQAAEQEKQP